MLGARQVGKTTLVRQLMKQYKVDKSILINDSGMSRQEFLTIDPNLL